MFSLTPVTTERGKKEKKRGEGKKKKTDKKWQIINQDKIMHVFLSVYQEFWWLRNTQNIQDLSHKGPHSLWIKRMHKAPSGCDPGYGFPSSHFKNLLLAIVWHVDSCRTSYILHFLFKSRLDKVTQFHKWEHFSDKERRKSATGGASFGKKKKIKKRLGNHFLCCIGSVEAQTTVFFERWLWLVITVRWTIVMQAKNKK